MSRLPTALQPAWPVVKRLHRATTRGLGAVTRRTSSGDRAVPVRATESADETAALEPESVVLHPGGPAEQLRRTVPVGSPADHRVFRDRASYDVPRRFTLAIEDGLLVGDYAAHITPGGLLDYETSTYFGIKGWPEHPIYLRPRLPAPEHFSGTLVSLATRGSTANYYHFLMDVLPRLGVLQETMPGVVPDGYFVNTRTGYQKQLLALAGLTDIPVLEPSKHSAVRADRLLVPCIPNPDLMAPTWTTQWVKSRLPASSAAGLPTRLYVTRGSARNTRRLANEDALWPLLEARGFTRLDPGKHTVQEQIDLFSAASVVVAPHGAALANLVFCNPGVRVLELFAPRYVNPCYWVIVDNIADSRYRYLVCGTDTRRPGAPMNGVLTDITADPAAFEAALDELLS